MTDGVNTSEKAKNYWEGEAQTSKLKVYAFMVPGSTVIRYGYGLGTYMDGEADIGATPHMFVGKSSTTLYHQFITISPPH